MNVNKVTATVRYSQDTGKGAWKSLEIGVEASVDEREGWQAAQAHLYADLAKQFKALWSANGVTAHEEACPEHSRGGHQTDVPSPSSAENHTPVPANGSTGTPDHYCQEHNQAFKARTGQYGEFYSHQVKGTKEWCNEKT